MNNRKLHFFAFLLALIAFAAFPLRTAHAKVVSLDSFIAETIRNNPTVKGYIQKYFEAKGGEYSARGIDDVKLESLFALAHKESAALALFQSTEDQQIAYQIGASKIISQTGTRIGASWSDARTASNYLPLPFSIPGVTNPPDTVYSPSISLELMQPLLKNLMGIQDRLNINLSRIKLEATNLTYQENVETFISEMSDLYLRWLSAYDNANTFEQIYRKISEEESIVRDEVDAKVAEDSDLYRVLEQKSFYKAQWEGFMALFESLTREVAAMMYPDSPPNDILPRSTSGSFLKVELNKNEALEYLRNQSRLRGILDLSLDSQNEILNANKNGRLPDMNVFVKYRHHGSPTGIDNYGSNFNKNDISGGLNFSVPIPNRAARGQFREQEAKTKRTEFENERVMLDATSKLDGLYSQRARLEQQVKSFEDQLNFGQKKLAEELDQYRDGRLSLFELLQDTSTHISNRVQLEAARYNLSRTILTINELTDRSLAAFDGVIGEVTSQSGIEKPAAAKPVAVENIPAEGAQ